MSSPQSLLFYRIICGYIYFFCLFFRAVHCPSWSCLIPKFSTHHGLHTRGLWLPPAPEPPQISLLPFCLSCPHSLDFPFAGPAARLSPFPTEIGRRVIGIYLWLLHFPQTLKFNHGFKQPCLNLPCTVGVSDKDALFSREAVISLWNVICLEIMVLQGLWVGFVFLGVVR